VAPPINKESAHLATESGFIRSITWEEEYGFRRRWIRTNRRSRTAVELSARVYSMLTGILAALAFNAVLILLRR
jgi:hypothetical protein